MRIFRDRREAGRWLAERLHAYADRSDVALLALPRGGVPVAYEVSQSLHVPLDVFIVRKLGVPGHRELAMGAIATGGIQVLNEEVVRGLEIPHQAVSEAAEKEKAEILRRETAYRGARPAPTLKDRTVILIDDGLATGSTMLAAVRAVRSQSPAHVVVAVPVASPEACRALEIEADRVVCLSTPDPFQAVGLWYEDFDQTTDEEVRALLQEGTSVPASP